MPRTDSDLPALKPVDVDPILLSTVRVSTFDGTRGKTNASGFFFERDERLFLVSSRHVMHDEPTKHFPDRIELELHDDSSNLAHSIGFSIPLYRNRRAIWRQAEDSFGEVDVAVIEVDRSALPADCPIRPFTPAHLPSGKARYDVGTPLLVLGFPLGFHDTLHHMPVARGAVIASSYGLRFQGQGYFLTDARTHRGTSGAPVVTRIARPRAADHRELPWMLLGVHSARLDVRSRELDVDEALGLNCAWYADILMTLTAA